MAKSQIIEGGILGHVGFDDFLNALLLSGKRVAAPRFSKGANAGEIKKKDDGLGFHSISYSNQRDAYSDPFDTSMV